MLCTTARSARRRRGERTRSASESLLLGVTVTRQAQQRVDLSDLFNFNNAD